MSELNINNLTDINGITEQPDGTYKVTKDGLNSTAILDKLLYTVKENLDAQYKSGRIRKEEYAQAYVALYQASLQGAINIFLQKDLLEKQIEKEQNQIELIKRQKIGFDEDYIIKATESYLQSYLAFLSSLPNVEDQPYPSAFTGQYHLNFQDEISLKAKNPEQNDYTKVEDKDAPIKLKFLDGVMGTLVNRIAYYQTKESDRPTFVPPCKPDEVNKPDK